MSQPAAMTPSDTATILAGKFMVSLGVVCLHGEAVAGHTRLTCRNFTGYRLAGERVWFRSQREAERIQKELIAGCKYASVGKGHLLVRQAPVVTADIIRTAAQLVGIVAILEQDIATTLDSVTRRIDHQLIRMRKDGSMRRFDREYKALRQGTKDRGQSGDNGDKGDKALPSYRNWLLQRLGAELTGLHHSGAFTRL
jgi:hypothetical protein